MLNKYFLNGPVISERPSQRAVLLSVKGLVDRVGDVPKYLESADEAEYDSFLFLQEIS